MRILIYPTYEFLSNIKADSSFILTKAFAMQAAEHNHHSYWVRPNVDENDAMQGVTQVMTNVKKSRDMNEVLQYDVLDKFSPVDGMYPLDAVISNNAGKAYEYLNFFSLNNFKRVNVPVYIWDFSTKFEGDCEITNINDINLATHALSYAFSRHNIFFSNYSMRRAAENLRKFSSSYLLDKFYEKSTVIPIAFDSVELDKHLMKKHEKPTFYFGGRFTATKGGEKIIEQYDYLYAYGRDIQIHVTTPNNNNTRLQKFLSKKGQEIEFYYGLPQHEAWEVMSKCHISIYHQSLKMFPAAPFEQLYAGLIVLFRDYGYEKEILPPNYPFLYRDKNEAAGMVRYVLENYDKAKSQIAYVKDWLKENVDRRKGISRILDIMERNKESEYKEKKFISDRFEGKNIVEWGQLIQEMKNNAKHASLIFANSKNGNKRGYMISEIHQKLIPPEFKDNCKFEFPVYEKQ